MKCTATLGRTTWHWHRWPARASDRAPGAIWVADQNAVYLHDASGARHAKLRLKNRLTIPEEERAA
jgi:hypothetical protein